jgi:hypothetical protein
MHEMALKQKLSFYKWYKKKFSSRKKLILVEKSLHYI